MLRVGRINKFLKKEKKNSQLFFQLRNLQEVTSTSGGENQVSNSTLMRYQKD